MTTLYLVPYIFYKSRWVATTNLFKFPISTSYFDNFLHNSKDNTCLEENKFMQNSRNPSECAYFDGYLPSCPMPPRPHPSSNMDIDCHIGPRHILMCPPTQWRKLMDRLIWMLRWSRSHGTYFSPIVYRPNT